MTCSDLIEVVKVDAAAGRDGADVDDGRRAAHSGSAASGQVPGAPERRDAAAEAQGTPAGAQAEAGAPAAAGQDQTQIHPCVVASASK